MTKICTLEECERPCFCKGYCRRHYERWKRHGDPRVLLKQMVARGVPQRWLEDHASHDGDGCLIWPFARFPDGRAHMRAGKPARIMCELAHGESPSSIHEAAHSCGQAGAGCVNPKHLRWATPVENAADKERHGTVIKGTAHPSAKLTEEAVREIRGLHGALSLRRLAARYGVGVPVVHRIVQRLTWRHVL